MRDGLRLLKYAGDLAIDDGTGKIDVEKVRAAWKRLENWKILEKISALPRSLRVTMAAMYIAALDSRKPSVTTDEVFNWVGELRSLLKMEPVAISSVRRYISELETYGLVDIQRMSRGKGSGVERRYILSVNYDQLLEALRTDADLYAEVKQIVKGIIGAKVEVAREKRLL